MKDSSPPGTCFKLFHVCHVLILILWGEEGDNMKERGIKIRKICSLYASSFLQKG